MKTRIAKFISDSGVASRRQAEDLIATGRVTVNGEKIMTPVFFVEDGMTVEIDGKKISARTDTKLYAFHKPINVMTTAHDDAGRKTIYDCLPAQYGGLKYVGRLDYKTTGLLLLTNDGALARRLTLPSSQIPRTYIATVGAPRGLGGLERARRGITIDGVSYRPMKISVISKNDGAAQLRITITEGKKNEIRIVLRACGTPVRKLHRVSFATIELGNLAVGKIREISQKNIDALIKSL